MKQLLPLLAITLALLFTPGPLAGLPLVGVPHGFCSTMPDFRGLNRQEWGAAYGIRSGGLAQKPLTNSVGAAQCALLDLQGCGEKVR
jgi:hypothetical protein